MLKTRYATGLKNKNSSPKDEQTLREKWVTALPAITVRHPVAFENAQPVITNERKPYEHPVTEQLSIRTSIKNNHNKIDISSLCEARLPLMS